MSSAMIFLTLCPACRRFMRGAHSRVIVSPDDDLVVPHEHRAAVQHVVEDTRPDQVGVGEEAQGLGQFLDDAAGTILVSWSVPMPTRAV
jgi:hypothetical protein